MILEVHSETPRSIESLRRDDIEQVVRSIDWSAPDSLTLSLDDMNALFAIFNNSSPQPSLSPASAVS